MLYIHIYISASEAERERETEPTNQGNKYCTFKIKHQKTGLSTLVLSLSFKFTGQCTVRTTVPHSVVDTFKVEKGEKNACTHLHDHEK